MLRWQSADSPRVYACLDASAYAAHLDATAEADVSSVRAAHLPLLDSYNMALYSYKAILQNLLQLEKRV